MCQKYLQLYIGTKQYESFLKFSIEKKIIRWVGIIIEYLLLLLTISIDLVFIWYVNILYGTSTKKKKMFPTFGMQINKIWYVSFVQNLEFLPIKNNQYNNSTKQI